MMQRTINSIGIKTQTFRPNLRVGDNVRNSALQILKKIILRLKLIVFLFVAVILRGI